ncbi:hypothetical protein PC117_g16737 [Phytophthora cactorum]|uniref:Uncharacterized protein n=1 Tax=Phytophthora cactorum TaxID=29920 RepID=A0A8T1CHK3_9STRA|nr:hypothetical protein PC117_g16737 [Phytophthora cactorum]
MVVVTKLLLVKPLSDELPVLAWMLARTSCPWWSSCCWPSFYCSRGRGGRGGQAASERGGQAAGADTDANEVAVVLSGCSIKAYCERGQTRLPAAFYHPFVY